MLEKITTILLIIALTAVSSASAHSSCKAECAQVKEKIRTIEARMRSGYTRAQGERNEAKLRELKAKRHKLCR